MSETGQEFSIFFKILNVLEDASNQELLDSWKKGNENAAQVLVQRYMLRLTALARSRLSRRLARRVDAEDIVMSAWRSFFIGANLGKLSISEDDDLWPLLVTITVRKLARQTARHTAGRRNVGFEVMFDENIDWQIAVSRDPSPEEAAILVDEVEYVMGSVGEVDREILTRRLQGEGYAEIAVAMECSERTVRRSMQRIRTIIAEHGDASISEVEVSGRSVVRETASKEESVIISQTDLLPTIRYTDITLKQLIGNGGFGKVYRSTYDTDGSIVAVKFLRKKFWKDHRARYQLLREARVVSSLKHPNIILHRGWGESPRGALFVVMDWVNGVSAGEWFAHNRNSVREIIQCGLAVSEALKTAHAAGLVHADITPGNVLRNVDGSFILTDFGFSKLVGDRMSEVGGTPGFLAPEQVSNLFGPVGVHTDVYGLGGLIYSLLTGSTPMSGGNVSDILSNVLSLRSPQCVSKLSEGIPQHLDEILIRCLQKEPSHRPQSIKEVSSVLRDIEKQI